MHRGLILRLFVLLTGVSRPVSTLFGHGFLYLHSLSCLDVPRLRLDRVMSDDCIHIHRKKYIVWDPRW